MKNYNKYTFFYAARNPFSNWHRCSFIDEENNRYNCTEQYMMARKAREFSDFETLELIMNSKDPKEQKALGRQVKNFKSEVWNDIARSVVYDGCWFKFDQNPELFKKLKETDGTLLVEASKWDLIWGVGLSEDDPRIQDPRNWVGTNWLGEVLTELREDMLNDDYGL